MDAVGVKDGAAVRVDVGVGGGVLVFEVVGVGDKVLVGVKVREGVGDIVGVQVGAKDGSRHAGSESAELFGSRVAPN